MGNEFTDKVRRRLDKGSGHGSSVDADDGWVDPKPYVSVRRNGIFEGYDGTLWMYFKFPVSVKVEWTKTAEEAVLNQHFFVDVCRELGTWIDGQVSRTKNDVRRKFHIQITQEPYEGILPYDGITPAHRDYLNRMSQNGRITHPVWTGYVGFQLHPSSVFYEAYGVGARFKRWWQVMTDPGALQFHLYQQEITDLVSLMINHGFRPLDFAMDDTDLERITAWYGITDEAHGMSRNLVTTDVKEPLHGMSIVVPRWDEVTFYAVKPSDELFMTDPRRDRSRWGTALFRPGVNTVAINIRGEIRSKKIVDTVMDQKRTKKIDTKSGTLNPAQLGIDPAENAKMVSRLGVSREVAEVLPMLDNVEILVGTQVSSEVAPQLPLALHYFDLQALPVRYRQPQALMSTIPTYPKPVFRSKRGNNNRPPLTNQMFPGVLAMSGIFRSTQPCADGGVLLGLSDGGYSYREIYTKVDDANTFHAPPCMLISGRPGAGKTQEMLQISSQVVYQGHGLVFINPKTDGSLAPFFEHLGGVVVKMNDEYLMNNPGIMDPVFFLASRSEVAKVLSNALISCLKLNQEMGSTGSLRRSAITADITERAKDLRNRTSWDILFGNKEAGTTPIGDAEVLATVTNKVNSAPFWRAFISRADRGSEMQQRLASSRCVLIEWDGSMQLPDLKDDPQQYTDIQLDSVQSVIVAFNYAGEIVGQGRRGGAVIADEAWVFKSSPEANRILDKAGREWRQRNIWLILGTQRMLDFLKKGAEQNMASMFARYLIMAVSEKDDEEIDMYYRLTGLERTPENTHYIVNAGVLKEDDPTKRANAIPRAYYIDIIRKWEGGIICGPWPERELSLGRTDRSAEEARASDLERDLMDATSMYGGGLAATAAATAARQIASLEDPVAVQ